MNVAHNLSATGKRSSVCIICLKKEGHCRKLSDCKDLRVLCVLLGFTLNNSFSLKSCTMCCGLLHRLVKTLDHLQITLSHFFNNKLSNITPINKVDFLKVKSNTVYNWHEKERLTKESKLTKDVPDKRLSIDQIIKPCSVVLQRIDAPSKSKTVPKKRSKVMNSVETDPTIDAASDQNSNDVCILSDDETSVDIICPEDELLNEIQLQTDTQNDPKNTSARNFDSKVSPKQIKSGPNIGGIRVNPLLGGLFGRDDVRNVPNLQNVPENLPNLINQKASSLTSNARSTVAAGMQTEPISRTFNVTLGDQPPFATIGDQPPFATIVEQPSFATIVHQPPFATIVDQPPFATIGNQPPFATIGYQPPFGQILNTTQTDQSTFMNQITNLNQNGQAEPVRVAYSGSGQPLGLLFPVEIQNVMSSKANEVQQPITSEIIIDVDDEPERASFEVADPPNYASSQNKKRRGAAKALVEKSRQPFICNKIDRTKKAPIKKIVRTRKPSTEFAELTKVSYLNSDLTSVESQTRKTASHHIDVEPILSSLLKSELENTATQPKRIVSQKPVDKPMSNLVDKWKNCFDPQVKPRPPNFVDIEAEIDATTSQEMCQIENAFSLVDNTVLKSKNALIRPEKDKAQPSSLWQDAFVKATSTNEVEANLLQHKPARRNSKPYTLKYCPVDPKTQ